MDPLLTTLLNRVAHDNVNGHVCYVIGLRFRGDCRGRLPISIPLNWSTNDLNSATEILKKAPLRNPRTGNLTEGSKKVLAIETMMSELLTPKEGGFPNFCLLILTAAEGEYLPAHSWVLKQIHEAPPHPSEELNNLNLLALVSCTMRDPILREIPMELSSSYPLVVRSTRHGSVRVSRFLHPLLAFLHLNLVSGFEPCLNFPPVPQLFQFWQECSNLLALRVGKDAVYKYVRGALKGGAENSGSRFSPIASFLIEKNETIAF